MASGLFHHISQRYKIQGQLGEGGMGVVYRAHDRLTDTTVALKQVNISPSYLTFNTTGADAALALAKEFRVLAGLRHPNIVSVLDYGFDKQRNPFYTMQLLENAHALTDYARHQPEAERIRLIIDTLHALVYLHRYGILHRDLKPTNVLVLPDGTVQVVDFGLALHYDAAGKADDPSSGAGTLMYMAPERLHGASSSVASDLYAVGCMLYEVMVGESPFFNVAPVDFILAVMEGQIDLSLLPSHYVPIARRLLAKDPADRYPNARAAIAALYAVLDAPVPPESPQQRESFLQASSFVGRTTELGLLREALQHAILGTSSVWLLGGESGVGKSRLLDEIRTQALCDGALVVRGQAVAEGGLPYQVWRDVLRRLVLEVDVPEGEAVLLKRLVPDIDALLGQDLPDVAPFSERSEQERLVQAIVDVLRRQTAPIVVLLEDLHWATESLTPIQHLLTVLDQVPHVLIVGSYRSDERPDLPSALRGATVLTLSRLDAATMGQLTAKMLGPEANNPALLDLLQRETEGNPFFMVEVMRTLAEMAGSLAAISQTDLPTTIAAGGVQHLITRRLNRIPDRYQPLLKQAAVAGRVFDLHLLRAMGFGDGLEDFLLTAASLHIVDVSDGAWRFSHDKLREAMLESLTDDERRDLNRDLAHAIEATYPDNNAYHETLMNCWRAVGDTVRELHYLLPVAAATRITNLARAELLVQRGLELAPVDDLCHVRLLYVLAYIHHDFGRYATALEVGQQAVARAEAASHAELLMQCLDVVGITLRFMGDLEAATAIFQRMKAVAETADNTDRQATALYRLGGVQSDMGNHQASLDILLQALAIKRTIPDPPDLEAVLLTIGMTLLDMGQPERAKTYIAESQSRADAHSNPKMAAHATNLLGHVAAGQKDYKAAHQHFADGLHMAKRAGHLSLQATSLNNLATTAYLLKDYPQALDLLHQSNDLAARLGRKPLQLANASSMAMVLLALESLEVAAAIRTGLTLGLEISFAPIVIDLLCHSATLFILADAPDKALPLVGLIAAHPATTADAHEQHLPQLRAALDVRLDAATIAAGMAQGATQTVEDVSRAVLAEPLDAWAHKAFGPPQNHA